MAQSRRDSVDGAVEPEGGRARRRRTRDRGAAPSTLSFPEQINLAREAALRLLSVRERSAAELRMRLTQKGFSPEPIDEVLTRLRETGLQDDRRFAESYASNAGEMRGYSARRIQNDLRGKGVGPELAAAVAAVRPEDEEERAREVAMRKARTMGVLPREVMARRLMGLLARRGYAPGICHRVVSEILSLDPEAEDVSDGRRRPEVFDDGRVLDGRTDDGRGLDE